jgi:hypothetical protein
VYDTGGEPSGATRNGSTTPTGYRTYPQTVMETWPYPPGANAWP